jgi:hypothetical protein
MACTLESDKLARLFPSGLLWLNNKFATQVPEQIKYIKFN